MTPTTDSTRATRYVTGRNPVSYISQGEPIAAHLYLPPAFDPGRQYPGIVVVRPATGVKEQTAGLYAEKLATRGFVTLAFDPRGFGESGGRPAVENPARIVEDTRSSIDFLAGLPFVSPANLFAAGTCMGGGYAALESTTDPRIKAVGAITPYLTMHLDYPALFGGRTLTLMMATVTDVIVRMLGAVGINIYSWAVPPNRFLARLPCTLPIARGMRDYYLPGQPGDQPTWRNRINWLCQLSLVRYDPFEMTARITRPFYMAYGSKGYSPQLLQRFFDTVRTPPGDKQVRIVDGTHFEIYWQPRFVDPIVDDIATFFGRYVA